MKRTQMAYDPKAPWLAYDEIGETLIQCGKEEQGRRMKRLANCMKLGCDKASAALHECCNEDDAAMYSLRVPVI